MSINITMKYSFGRKVTFLYDKIAKENSHIIRKTAKEFCVFF